MSELDDAIDFFANTGEMEPKTVYSPELLVILDAAKREANRTPTFDQLVFMVANACASADMQSGPFNMLAELDEDIAAAYRRFATKHVDFLFALGITPKDDE